MRSLVLHAHTEVELDAVLIDRPRLGFVVCIVFQQIVGEIEGIERRGDVRRHVHVRRGMVSERWVARFGYAPGASG
jgi:hypothetical protein